MDARGRNKDAMSQKHTDLAGDPSGIISPKTKESSPERLSYLRLWNFLILSIFMAEVVAMIATYALPPLPYAVITLIDAGVMTILIFPLLYFWSFQPMLRHLDERQQAEKQLRKAHDELEARVQERTEELRIAISELEDEINVRRRTEEALRQSEQRLKRAQEIAHLGSWELDRVHNSLTWSDEVYRIFGLQPQEFGASYEAFLETVHPDDRTAVDEAYSGSTREGRDSYEIEHRVVKRSSGEVRVVHEKCEHFRDQTGRIIRSVGMVHDITERKQAEDALREAAERFRVVADFTHDWEYWRGLDNHFHYISPSCETITGYQREAFNDDPNLFLQIVHPDDRERLAAHYHDDLNSDEPYEIEFRILRRDGQERWLGHACRLVMDSDGNSLGRRASNRDITERKQAEAALRESEEKLRSAFARAAIGFAMTTPDGRFVNANPAYCLLTGYSLDELRTLEIPHLIHPQDRAENLTLLDQMLTGQIHDFVLDNRYLRKDGELVWVRKSVSLVRDVNGISQWIIVLVEDITARKQAEEILQNAHDQLELRVHERTRELRKEIAERKEVERQLRLQTTAIEAAANGIVITDPHGTIQWANPAILRISGYEADELVGRNTRVFGSGQHDQGYYQTMWNSILSGQVWHGETINRRKDGTLYMEEQTITPVWAEQGEVAHFIAIKQDITERKKAEEKLAQRNVELQLISSAERYQRQFSEALIEAAIILNRSLKLNDVLSLILEQIRGVIPYQNADIVFLEGESFYVASHQGEFQRSPAAAETGDRLLVESFPLLNRMCTSGRPVLLMDVLEEPEWIPLKGFEWTRSFLSAPLLVENKVIGFVNLFGDQPRFFNQVMSDRLVAFAAHAAVAIQNAWLFEQVQASTERLQSLSRRLVEIQENERRYISRELHDEAGQVLTSLLLDLRLLEKNSGQPDAILKIAAEMERSLNGVIENLHRMAMALRPASLDHVGLVAALRQHVEGISEKHGIQASFRSGGVVERLPANVETVLYRTVQEALTNVIRHAQATRVDVVLTTRDDKLVVLVEDDGVGFDPANESDDGHLGLFGIRERTEMIGGTLVIESAPGKGTTIMLEVDYADTAAGRR